MAPLRLAGKMPRAIATDAASLQAAVADDADEQLSRWDDARGGSCPVDFGDLSPSPWNCRSPWDYPSATRNEPPCSAYSSSDHAAWSLVGAWRGGAPPAPISLVAGLPPPPPAADYDEVQSFAETFGGTFGGTFDASAAEFPTAALRGAAPEHFDTSSTGSREQDLESTTTASSAESCKPLYTPPNIPNWAAQFNHMPRVTDSSVHAQGLCKPCTFFHTKGCSAGPACKFCHLCPAGEFRRRKKLIRALRLERDALLGLRERVAGGPSYE